MLFFKENLFETKFEQLTNKTFFCLLGPAAPHGYVPKYSANGTQYYLVSLAVFLVYAFLIDTSICGQVTYHNPI